ncbi:MAG TPA: alanine racemase [Tepidisphaeraceae bacterium]|nr:alanine racemase [Tepidisphaeraceae bacterium]
MDAKLSLGEPRCLISRQAILHNAALIRRTVGQDVKICAVIKADGYGHGAEIVADALCNFSIDELEGPLVDYLAVADLDEAASLPEMPLPLLVLRPVENVFLGRQRARLEAAVRGGWTLTVCSLAAADDLTRIAVACETRANVQIKLDTGMTRAGTSLPDFEALLTKILSQPALRLVGLYTHFACGEIPDHPFTSQQLARFIQATALCPRGGRLIRHAANSGAMFCMPETRLDMVRPGISLYGIDPLCRPCLDRPLRPVMKWTAPLVGIRSVPAGVSVGYGQSFTSPTPMRLGLVPVGYADGYLRQFSNRAQTIVQARPASVVGRVSMDFLTIDLTDIPHATIGDEVTLLDDDPLSPASAYKLAELADTIPYEICCRVGPRVRRIVVDPADRPVRPIAPDHEPTPEARSEE